MRRVLVPAAVALILALSACAAEETGSEAADTAGETGRETERAEPKRATSVEPKKDEKVQPAKEPRSTPPRPKPRSKRARSYPVLRVIDGDTVEVGYRGGVSVRLIGIDTPETVSPSVSDECWGAAASRAAEKLLGGRRIALRFDPSQGRLDTYGRTLAYLAVPGVGDFGKAMIKRGHAAEYTYDTGYRMQSSYQAAETAARRSGRGLWGRCGGPDKAITKPKAQSAQRPRAGGRCEPGYDPCVPPYPPDVDCADVDGPVSVTGSDPHGLDADGDGVACE